MRGNREYLLDNSVDKRTSNALNLFWAGFIIYTLMITIGSNAKIAPYLQLLGMVIFIIPTFHLLTFKIENKYLKNIYIIYCGWLFFVIVRGFTFNYQYLLETLLDRRRGIFIYFTPLILLFPMNLAFYKKVFDVVIIFGIFYIIYDILFIKDLLNSDRSSIRSQGIVETFSALSFPSGFLLLTYAYHSKKRQLLAIGVTVLALLFAVIRARRGLIFMYGTMIFLSYIFYVFHSKLKLLIIYLTIFIALLGAVYVSGIYKPQDSRLFGSLIDRGDEDTRSGVELYFYNDMKTKDWIIGRGINGEYFCPDIEENQLTNYRDTIETGYLQTILKGGLISLGLFLLIAIPAIIKGLFYSKNILSKVAGIWIFLSLINSYPATVNAFTLQYLLVWISIGICYSKEIRNIPESSMKDIFLTLTSSSSR